MNPGIILALMLMAGSAGGLFYSYHIGRTQGEIKCEAVLLEAKLKQKEAELNTANQLSEFQQEQISEVQKRLEEESEANAQLKTDLDKALSGKPIGCITPGMRDAIKEYRAKARGKNS